MGKTRRIISIILIAVMLAAMAASGVACSKQDDGDDKAASAISELDTNLD